jgi:hypothetical protein
MVLSWTEKALISSSLGEGRERFSIASGYTQAFPNSSSNMRGNVLGVLNTISREFFGHSRPVGIKLSSY